ncbi:MAG: hypothetical protein Q9225_004569, partial [Loekoesia sp. 1 TL-2023]
MEQGGPVRHVPPTPTTSSPLSPTEHPSGTKSKSRLAEREAASTKRRCVSTACIACRRRKSKARDLTPTDDKLLTSNRASSAMGTPLAALLVLQSTGLNASTIPTLIIAVKTLIQAILNYPEHEVPELVRQIRTCESLDTVAESIIAKGRHLEDDVDEPESPFTDNEPLVGIPRFEKELSGKMAELRLDNGSVSFVGGTSNLIFLGSGFDNGQAMNNSSEQYQRQSYPITSWTEVTKDKNLIVHLMNMYFTWHYTFFTTLSKSLFYRDFLLGKPPPEMKRRTEYCTPLLVNAMLALGCHFTSWPAARSNPSDSATAGDHFFREAKRLILENDEHESPRLATVQALALIGMSFRMAYDLGLNVDSGLLNLDEEETDARRMTIWGCFLFDKCWSNYLGRQPQVPLSSVAVPKFDVFPMEDSETWSPYTDAGIGESHTQPARTRAVAIQVSSLCEISADLLAYFYHPTNIEKPLGKQAELKKLSELHTRLEAWRKNLPKELEPRDGQLACVLVM